MPLRMPLMILPIPRIPFSQFLVMDHKKVLCIVLLGCLGKIEAPGNHCLSIDDHDLVMGDSVLGIYFNRYPLVIEKGG